MTTVDRELVLGTARWVARGGGASQQTSKQESFVAGRRLLEDGHSPSLNAPDVLHAACQLIIEESEPPRALAEAGNLFAFLVGGACDPDFADERAELLSLCAYGGWRAARRAGNFPVAESWMRKAGASGWLDSFGSVSANQASLLTVGEDVSWAWTDQPALLLALCARLPELIDKSPSSGLLYSEAAFWSASRPAEPSSRHADYHYFRGELALMAGAACRHLSRRPDAWQWFDRAEAEFRQTADSRLDLSRLHYQRLAEQMEERQFDAVLAMLPDLIKGFQELGMLDDAVKVRFLEGLVLIETGQFPEAVRVFHEICRQAKELGNEKLVATSYANLTNIYGMMGKPDEAIETSRQAIPVLQRLNDRIVLSKIQWALAALLREKGHLKAAIDAYRQAQQHFLALGMRADIAALNLIVGDLLLELGQHAEALSEISAALPVIAELKMAPEGMAALSLLRESSRRQEINRAALRELHSHFPKPDA